MNLQDYSNELAQVVELVSKSVVRVDARHRVAGTGIAWSNDGVILTADHVVEREENIHVTLGDGSELAAELVGRDPATDIAALRVKGVSLTPVALAPLAGLRVGHLVIAVGKPWDNEIVVSAGVVSSLSRGRQRGPFRDGLVQTDAVMLPGFSGGPLVDASGRIVGMNSSVLGRGASLAIPHETAARVVSQLLKEGRVKRGYLGVGVQTVPIAESLAQKLGLKQEAGQMILTIESGAPAEKAGLLPGDILVALNGDSLEHTHELHRWLAADRADQSVKAQVIRGGELQALTVTIGTR